MATTVNSDLIIYNDQAQTAYLERIQDVIEVFNGASQGTVILDSEAIEGDFRERAFYKIGGALGHRDVNSTAAVVGQKIGADDMVGVKSPWKYGPYETTEEAFKRRARSPEEFSQLVGQDMADAFLVYAIAAAFGSLEAAIGANGNMVASASIATDGKKALTKGLRKFGDRSNRVAVLAMHSSTYFDLVDQAIDNKVFEEAGVVIYGGQPGTLGKPVLVSDQISDELIFGLQAGAARITESQAPGVRSYPINTQENLAIGYRAEGVFNVDLLGYSWNKDAASPATPAPANPNLTQLSAAANWVKHFTSDKSTAGVIIDLSGS